MGADAAIVRVRENFRRLGRVCHNRVIRITGLGIITQRDGSDHVQCLGCGRDVNGAATGAGPLGR